MASKQEIQRRKASYRAAARAQQEAEEAAMPISREQLAGLFDHLDAAGEPCRHTLALTSAYLAAHGLPQETILPWLGRYGGYCDCEVLANVEDHWAK
jgi:hypothetical protein